MAERIYPPGLKHGHQHGTDQEDPIEDPLRVEQEDETKLRITVFQPDGTKLNATINNYPASDRFSNRPHPMELPHNTLKTVWTPASGYKPHLVSLLASTEAAGRITLYYDEGSGDVEWARLDFNLRQTQPFGAGTDIDFAKDAVLKAKWVADAATPSAWITMIGHEHKVE
jgi:hypothetical protein